MESLLSLKIASMASSVAPYDEAHCPAVRSHQNLSVSVSKVQDHVIEAARRERRAKQPPARKIQVLVEQTPTRQLYASTTRIYG